MDKSLNDTTSSIMQCSPPKRRRSTFFERRDSLVPQNYEEITTNHEESKEKENAKYEEELAEYLNKLTEEKEKWKTELKERKTKHRELKLQLALVASNTQNKYNYSLLTDEDIQFLNNKTNIAKLNEKTLEMNNKLKGSLQMYQNLKQLDNCLLEFCEYRLDEMQTHILNNSSLGEFIDKTRDIYKCI